MRKHILIGLLAVMAGGVVAFFVSQPKKGSIEWHKRKYRAARNEMFGVCWNKPVKDWYFDIMKKPQRGLSSAEIRALTERQMAARQGLTKQGFLVERSFAVSNLSATLAAQTVIGRARNVIPQDRFYYTGVLVAHSNTMVLAVVPEDVPAWERIVREVDVPEKGN